MISAEGPWVGRVGMACSVLHVYTPMLAALGNDMEWRCTENMRHYLSNKRKVRVTLIKLKTGVGYKLTDCEGLVGHRAGL